MPFAQVSLNVFAARIEKEIDVKIMNRAHGFWSMGIMAGSLTGVQLASFGLAVTVSLVSVAVVLMPILIMVANALPDIKTTQSKTVTDEALRPIPNAVWLVAAVIFGATIVEGAMIIGPPFIWSKSLVSFQDPKDWPSQSFPASSRLAALWVMP